MLGIQGPSSLNTGRAGSAPWVGCVKTTQPAFKIFQGTLSEVMQRRDDAVLIEVTIWNLQDLTHYVGPALWGGAQGE